MPPGEPEVAPTKRDLASWWKSFTRGGNANRKQEAPPRTYKTLRDFASHPLDFATHLVTTAEDTPETPSIFGVELQKSIKYANVAISLQDANGGTFTYGYVPIVVAKCGVFLKEKATETQGIFRLAGAERRVKELQRTFNTPERYGKGLDWEGYTVHDAAGVLRRYFNSLPEPVIPWTYYDKFRKPLVGHQAQAVGEMPSQRPSTGEFSPEAAIKTFQHLITELPPLNRQLLLYILDLLAVFAAKSEANNMDASNLAVIFQPGILHRPDHNLSPDEYRLNQDVLIFLIDNQDNFIVGMEGTEADEKTITEISNANQANQAKQQQQAQAQAQAKPVPGPHAPITTVNRTSSNASAAAESVRKFGGIRRNVSVSSRRSRQSANSSSPVTPPPDSPYSTTGNKSGVHRSNTVPSRKSGSPVVGSSKLQQQVTPLTQANPPKPAPAPAQATAAAAAIVTQPSAPSKNITASTIAPQAIPVPAPTLAKPSSRAPAPPPSAYPSGRMSPHLRPVPTAKDRARSNERKPNKLQKKRRDDPISAHSSTQSLGLASQPTSPAPPATRMTDAQRLEAFDPSARDLPEPAEGFSLEKEPFDAAPPPAAAAAEPRTSTGSRSEGAGGYSSADDKSGPEGAKKHSRWNFSISARKEKEAAREKK